MKTAKPIVGGWSEEQSTLLARRLIDDVNGAQPRNVPTLRRIRREYSRQVSDAPASFVIEIARILLKQEDTIPRYVPYELISHHEAALASLGTRELEILGKGMDSWDDVDCFAGYLSGAAWRAGQIGDEVIAGWAHSKDRWWRRAALVSTVSLNVRPEVGGIEGGDAKRTLEVCDILMEDRDDMVVKAMSWALRSLARRDPDSARAYMERNQEKLASRAIRELTNILTTGLKNPRRDGPMKKPK